jgi:hypothetical protein
VDYSSTSNKKKSILTKFLISLFRHWNLWITRPTWAQMLIHRIRGDTSNVTCRTSSPLRVAASLSGWAVHLATALSCSKLFVPPCSNCTLNCRLFSCIQTGLGVCESLGSKLSIKASRQQTSVVSFPSWLRASARLFSLTFGTSHLATIDFNGRRHLNVKSGRRWTRREEG